MRRHGFAKYLSDGITRQALVVTDRKKPMRKGARISIWRRLIGGKRK